MITTPDFSAYALGESTRVVCLRRSMPLIDSAPTTWVHIAVEGVWHGHPQGSFALTRSTFGSIVANFARRLGTPLPLDFDHERETKPLGEKLPARGWVHELEVREDGLWGLVEFGQEAVEDHKRGAWRFCSAVIDFQATDRVTGEPAGPLMTSLALTDDPFILGQEPIRLSARQTTNGERPMADETTQDDKTTNPGGGSDDGERQLSAADDAITALATATGMSAEEVLTALANKAEAVAALLKGDAQVPETDVTLSATQAQLSAHKKALSAAEQRAKDVEAQLAKYREKEANDAVEALIGEGKLLDTGRAFARQLFLSNRKGYDEFVAGLPTAVPAKAHATKHTPPTEQTSALPIPEDDTEVKELRLYLSNGGIRGAEADAIVRRRLAERHTGTRI